MLDLPHNSIKAIGEKGRRKLDDGYNTDAIQSMVVMRAQEAGTIGGGCFRRKGKGAKYGTLGANPMVL